ncbi:hypothetical protein Tco_0114407 [Tanacetum coccineum]
MGTRRSSINNLPKITPVKLRTTVSQFKEQWLWIINVGIKRLLDDLGVTVAQVCVAAAKLNYYCSKIKTAKRVSTVRERIKIEERIKIGWISRLLM